MRQAGATLHRGARASHYRGLSRCGAQSPDAQAQQLWLTGPVAPWHVGSSQTRARTRVPCIGRRILNHCATREAPKCRYSVITLYLGAPQDHLIPNQTTSWSSNCVAQCSSLPSLFQLYLRRRLRDAFLLVLRALSQNTVVHLLSSPTHCVSG